MEILGKVERLVKPEYDKLMWGMHIEDVVKNCERLARLEGGW